MRKPASLAWITASQVLKGKNAVAKYREVMNATNAEVADKDIIRAESARDIVSGPESPEIAAKQSNSASKRPGLSAEYRP